MNFPFRDRIKTPATLASQSGQAIVEYILVLVVTVMLILGGVYQLNTAFKSWAKGYFGDYLACLLETGELPNISGSGGDAGICKTLFKPFNLKDGFVGKTAKGGSGDSKKAGGGGSGAGSREAAGGGGGAGGSGGSSGRFRSTIASRSAAGAAGGRGKSDSNYTGSTGASGYGSGYSATNRRISTDTKPVLDNRFAFDKESEDKQKRNLSTGGKSQTAENGGTGGIRIHRKDKSKDDVIKEDQGMTFGNFIRFLIIAAIVVALVVLIGGQMLQVGKSME